MPSQRLKIKATFRRVACIIMIVLMVILMAGLILWLTGALNQRIWPGSKAPATATAAGLPTVPVRLITRTRTISAVGTIRPIHPVTIAARIVGRVVWTDLEVGAVLKKGQVIVRLDDRDLKTQLAQTLAAVHLARAELHQAHIDQRRDKTLLATGDVTQAAMDLADTGVATAQAGVARAVAARQSAQTVLAYATIHSPVDGIVRRKMVSVGDTVLPGTALAGVYNPSRMQLAAVVRESLSGKFHFGQKMPLKLEGINTVIPATIRQIVPRVNAHTRSFTVKATANFPPGVWPGMYGTLSIPIGTEHLLVIPDAAITYVGQLALVHIVRHHRVIRQVVRPGRRFGQLREILSGLRIGQRVVIPPGTNAKAARVIR